ncbi:MAG: phosphoglycerate kinase [Acidobacteriota bacterium]
MAGKLKLADLEVSDQRVLVRADLNVPVREGVVADETRIRATLPTLRWLLEADAAVILMAHRGRPRGNPDPALSMAPVAAALEQNLGVAIELLPDCVGAEVESRVAALRPGRVVLLENLRFHAGETANSPDFARSLVALAPLYVNDAFGVAHRAHASVVGVPAISEKAAAGLLLEREVEMLGKVLARPKAPFVVVLGGAKVSDKLAVIENLLPLADRLLVGGAMANALLVAKGAEMGISRLEEGSVDLGAQLLAQVAGQPVQLLLPEDFVVAPAVDEPGAAKEVEQVPAHSMVLDIGAKTRAQFCEALADARTVVWNGPMGVFEVGAFAAGTYAVARAIAALGSGALTVLGGGDTAAAAAAAGIGDQVTHMSTGGGASLELLGGIILPGVAALTDRSRADSPPEPASAMGGQEECHG